MSEKPNQPEAPSRSDMDSGPASWEAEDTRLRTIRNKRRTEGACIMCGKPMGWLDKRAGREQHEKCTRFIE